MPDFGLQEKGHDRLGSCDPGGNVPRSLLRPLIPTRQEPPRPDVSTAGHRCVYSALPAGDSGVSRALIRTTASVGGITLLSRVLGFLRDMVIARLFGAGMGADAFIVAFKIPNLLRRLFVEGAFAHAFVPVLSATREHRGHAAVRDLTGRVAGTLALWLFGITALAVAAAPLLILVFAPGFAHTGGRLDLAVEMLRLAFPYLMFIALTACAGGVLNTYGNYWVPAFTPALLNLSMIAAAFWLAPRLDAPVTALAWGVLLGGMLQLAFQLPFLARLRLLPRPRPRRADPEVRRILRGLGPAVIGVSVTQLNLLLDTFIASFLVTGSVSWLYYSDRLMEFPLGVLGLALATVLLPQLAREHLDGGRRFSGLLDWGLRWTVFIGMPAALGLVLLATPLITTLFQYGAFGGNDMRMAAGSLTAYAAGLVGFVAVKVLAPGHYARQEQRAPVRCAVAALVVNLLLSLLLVQPLAHVGLALATSIAALVNAALLGWSLVRQGVYRPEPGWPLLLAQVGAGCVALAAMSAAFTPPAETWLVWDGLQRAGRLALLVATGVIVYLGTAWAAGLRPRHLRAPR